MDGDRLIEEQPSLKLLARYGGEEGFVFLSSFYGSYEVEMDIPIPEGEVSELLCAKCREALPESGRCPECSAPMRRLKITDGPEVMICCRRGCKGHAIRFGEWEDIPISTIMRRGVVSVKDEKPLEQIVNILVNTNLNVLPVVNIEEELVGEISVFQLLTYLIPQEVDKIDYRSYRKLLHCYKDWQDLRVGDIMTTDIPTLHPDVLLEEAVRVFKRTGRLSLYVVKDHKILGAILVSDLCKALLEKKREET